MSASLSNSNPCARQVVENYSQAYHIGGVFIILVASVLGTSIPILGAHFPIMNRYPFVYICGKHIGTGVLISLSLIHLLAPAFQELGSPCDPEAFAVGYQYAPLFCILAALAMHAFEVIAADYFNKHSMSGNSAHATNVSFGGSGSPQFDKTQAINGNIKPEGVQAGQLEAGKFTTKEPMINICSNPKCSVPTNAEDDQTLATKTHVHAHVHGLLISSGHLRQSVSAYILEFGLATHSVIIGITTGIADDHTYSILLPALVFHQFFEGFALGARIAAVGFNKFTETVLTIVYSVTAPLGLAIGIGVVTTYNPNSSTANLVSGCFDSVSAGILLYVAFVQMVAGEFARDYAACRSNTEKAALFSCVYIGVSVMAVIGIWL